MRVIWDRRTGDRWQIVGPVAEDRRLRDRRQLVNWVNDEFILVPASVVES